ncbi:hypothetical protein J2X32_002916 [Rheinheimera pacifica]|uniref:hypothetical protein n=1 Tax=Rheinheimera pacifica TaxID=173990 RepID=UPI002860DAF7|nr:hypothetical protein [Rheinheimera pacifica]MDR6984272.1 hypothetical protein [Rheinheimera pacifica]
MRTVAQCGQHAKALALQFRLGITTQPALELANLAGQLITLFASATPQQIAQLQQLLTAVLQCQQNRDWSGLADYLEYELQELLAGSLA